MISRYRLTVMARVGTLNHAVAELLRQISEDSFVTQTELERRSGVSQSQVSKLLRNERRMTLDQFEALCAALKLSPVAVLAEAIGSRDEQGREG